MAKRNPTEEGVFVVGRGSKVVSCHWKLSQDGKVRVRQEGNDGWMAETVSCSFARSLSCLVFSNREQLAISNFMDR